MENVWQWGLQKAALLTLVLCTANAFTAPSVAAGVCTPSSLRNTRRPVAISKTIMLGETVSKTINLPSGINMEYREAGQVTTGKPPIVFIHGSFHGSWCWAELWMPFFARNGFACYAMTLRGASATPQVGDAKNVQLAEHIADLTAFIQSVVPGSTAPILIGHSFGGMYAQKICEANQLNIRALVLLCSVSPTGTTGTVLRYLFQKPALALVIVRAFVLKECATNIAICRRVFFSETDPPDPKVEEYMSHFAADSKVILDTRTAPKLFPGVTSAGPDGRCSWLSRLPPTLVVGAEKDVVVDKRAVEETADFYNSTLLWLEGPHDIMLSRTAGNAAAQAILHWIESL